MHRRSELQFGQPSIDNEYQTMTDQIKAAERKRKKLSRVFGTERFPFPPPDEGRSDTFPWATTQPAGVRTARDADPRSTHHRSKTAPSAVPTSQLPPLPYTRELDFKDTVLASPYTGAASASPQQRITTGSSARPLSEVSRYATAPTTAFRFPVARPNYPNPFPPDLTSLRKDHMGNQRGPSQDRTYSSPWSLDEYNEPSLHLPPTPTHKQQVPNPPDAFIGPDDRPVRPRPRHSQAMAQDTARQQRQSAFIDGKKRQDSRPPVPTFTAVELPADPQPSSQHDEKSHLKALRAAALTAAQEHWRPAPMHQGTAPELRHAPPGPTLPVGSASRGDARLEQSDGRSRARKARENPHADQRTSSAPPVQKQHQQQQPKIPGTRAPTPPGGHLAWLRSAVPTAQEALHSHPPPNPASTFDTILAPKASASSQIQEQLEIDAADDRGSRRFSFESISTAQAFTVMQPGRAKLVQKESLLRR